MTAAGSLKGAPQRYHMFSFAAFTPTSSSSLKRARSWSLSLVHCGAAAEEATLPTVAWAAPHPRRLWHDPRRAAVSHFVCVDVLSAGVGEGAGDRGGGGAWATAVASSLRVCDGCARAKDRRRWRRHAMFSSLRMSPRRERRPPAAPGGAGPAPARPGAPKTDCPGTPLAKRVTKCKCEWLKKTPRRNYLERNITT